MPRGPRLDAPGALHHVMVRGIEGREIFVDDADRNDFVDRVAKLALAGAWQVYAWALMANHAHLLLRTGSRPLERSMRSLLTGYAVWFNRRHGRVGHLFQNRYKSLLCLDEAYFLNLVRYVHRNPIAGKKPVLRSPAALDRYPYTGHSAIVGAVPRGWQEIEEVLARFRGAPEPPIEAYRKLIFGGLDEDDRGLNRGTAVEHRRGEFVTCRPNRRSRERFGPADRVLGDDEQVRSFLAGLNAEAMREGNGVRIVEPETVVELVCSRLAVSPIGFVSGSRQPTHSRARAGVAFIWTEILGFSARSLACALGLSTTAVCAAATRGRREARLWIEVSRHLVGGPISPSRS